MIWDDIKNLLKDNIGNSDFQTYILELEYDTNASRSDLAVFSISNVFLKNYIMSKYLSEIIRAFEIHTQIRPEIKIEVKKTESNKKNVKSLKPIAQNQNKAISNINPYYTFDKFVVGDSNRHAYTIAETISKNQAVYNPVLIHGKTGLGKTHLLHAIGNYAGNMGKEAIFISSEDFLNEYISRIKNGTMDRFRDKYRSCDYLLIDDVQFFGNKQGVQEELFHTFNILYSLKKQIVLSSDVLPRDMTGLEDRLKSRFEQGIIGEIEIPGLETKIAIIKLKCQLNNINLDDETISYIATHANENIRQIEGILTNINARMGLIQGSPINTAKLVLEDYQNKRQESITIKYIIETVSKELNIKISEIKSKSRARNVANARKIIIYLAKNFTSISLTNVAMELGMKDHSSVSKALKSINEEKEKKGKMSSLLEEITNKINAKN